MILFRWFGTGWGVLRSMLAPSERGRRFAHPPQRCRVDPIAPRLFWRGEPVRRRSRSLIRETDAAPEGVQEQWHALRSFATTTRRHPRRSEEAATPAPARLAPCPQPSQVPRRPDSPAQTRRSEQRAVQTCTWVTECTGCTGDTFPLVRNGMGVLRSMLAPSERGRRFAHPPQRCRVDPMLPSAHFGGGAGEAAVSLFDLRDRRRTGGGAGAMARAPSQPPPAGIRGVRKKQPPPPARHVPSSQPSQVPRRPDSPAQTRRSEQ